MDPVLPLLIHLSADLPSLFVADEANNWQAGERHVEAHQQQPQASQSAPADLLSRGNPEGHAQPLQNDSNSTNPLQGKGDAGAAGPEQAYQVGN